MQYTRIPTEDVDSEEKGTENEKEEGKSNENRNRRKLKRQGGVRISFDADVPASNKDESIYISTMSLSHFHIKDAEPVSLDEPTPDLTLKSPEPAPSDSSILTSAKSRRSLRQRVKTLSSLFQRRPLQRQVSFYGSSDVRAFRVR